MRLATPRSAFLRPTSVGFAVTRPDSIGGGVPSEKSGRSEHRRRHDDGFKNHGGRVTLAEAYEPVVPSADGRHGELQDGRGGHDRSPDAQGLRL